MRITSRADQIVCIVEFIMQTVMIQVVDWSVKNELINAKKFN
jgi:hypothetical protein